jgi:hypothetical protein
MIVQHRHRKVEIIYLSNRKSLASFERGLLWSKWLALFSSRNTTLSPVSSWVPQLTWIGKNWEANHKFPRIAVSIYEKSISPRNDYTVH